VELVVDVVEVVDDVALDVEVEVVVVPV